MYKHRKNKILARIVSVDSHTSITAAVYIIRALDVHIAVLVYTYDYYITPSTPYRVPKYKSTGEIPTLKLLCIYKIHVYR